MIEAAGRKGVTPDAARTLVRTNATVIAALALKQGLADAMICGVEGRYMGHLTHIRDIIGLAPGSSIFAALTTVITAKGVYFLADTHINPDPDAAAIAEMAIQAAAHVRRFGAEPKIALLSRSDFGSYDCDSAPQAARGAGADPRARAGAGGRRRDERRVRADARRSATGSIRTRASPARRTC